MPTELSAIPDIPGGLREAALRGSLVPFIGAGVSMLAGCPSWGAFADGALRWLIDQGRLSYSQLDQIDRLSPRVKLSLARSLAVGGAPINFEALLHPKPRNQNPKGCRVYNSLFALGKVFVTTNYDLWLDARFPEATAVPAAATAASSSPPPPMTVVYRREEFLPSLLDQSNTVIHLHGSARAPETMVITTSDYIRHYQAYGRSSTDPATENQVLTFLDFLFRNRTVLFVGYGLEELEILEYVIEKGPRQTGEAKHYILQGFFSHEQMLVRSLSSYYLSECGIQLLPFRRDEKNYDQLMDVLHEFAARMPATSPLMLQRMQDMEDLLR